MIDALLATWSQALGPDGVLVDPDAMAPFLADWRGVFFGRALAVVRPRSVEAVSRVLKDCIEHRIAVVPQGGNSGLAAAATPLDLERAIVMNLSRMNRIRALDPQGYTVTVDAGCVLADVQAAAEEAGRYFPLSLAAEGSAQIGGLIATNAGGTAVLRYGSMRALVLGLEVVLADGSIVDGMRALRKDNAGYDWKQWFVGSEGTLGVVTGAVLRLFAPQRSVMTALLSHPSLDGIMAAFAHAQEHLGDCLVAAELFPDTAVAMRLEQRSPREFPLARSEWYLLVEASSSIEGLADRLEAALLDVLDASGCDAVVAQSGAQREGLWDWRESISETERRAGKSAKHDVSVPVSSIAGFISEANAALMRTYPACTPLPFGHAGDGNIHYNVVLPSNGGVEPGELNALVHGVVARYRGSITAEHGIGRYRRSELPLHRSPQEMALLHAIKSAMDPAGIMNPGAVL